MADLVDMLLERMVGHARENLEDFRSDPELLGRFRKGLAQHRFRYAGDGLTCGKPDCWNTFRGLTLRDGAWGPWFADCEDLSCAIAASHVLAGLPILLGVIPGKKISHAVVGIPRDGGKRVQLIDPSVWFGMPAMEADRYATASWRPLTD